MLSNFRIRAELSGKPRAMSLAKKQKIFQLPLKIDYLWVKLDSVILSYQSKQVCGEYQQSRNWQFKIGVRIIVAAGAAAGVQICDCLPKSTPPTACQV